MNYYSPVSAAIKREGLEMLRSSLVSDRYLRPPIVVTDAWRDPLGALPTQQIGRSITVSLPTIHTTDHRGDVTCGGFVVGDPKRCAG